MTKSVADNLDLKLVESGALKLKAGKDPTRAEAAAIKRFEKGAGSRSARKLLADARRRGRQREAARATRPVYARRRRIAAKYKPYVAEIARLYVEADHNASATERVVRAKLGLEKFQSGYLVKWLQVPEFAAMVRAEEERQAAETVASPFVRGPKKVAWLAEVEQCMREAYDAADAEGGKQELLNAVHRVASEIRDEERFVEDLRVRRARRSFGRFLRNLLALARRSGEPLVVLTFLRAGLDKLDTLMGEMTDVEFNVADIAGRTG